MLPKIKKSRQVFVPELERAAIFLVGCGGTGSYLAPHLARMAYLQARDGMEVGLVFVDDDFVEPKNVERQNFAPVEVGERKALALAARYSMAFGLRIFGVPQKFSYDILNQFSAGSSYNTNRMDLIIGCVDGPQGRRSIDRAIREVINPNVYRQATRKMVAKGLWWLDAGNHYAHGQVRLGNALSSQPLFSELGFCFGLPLPSIQDPVLIANQPGPKALDPVSCADIAAENVQARTINTMMADWLFTYIQRLIVSRDLDMFCTELDQRLGMVNSYRITDGVIVSAKGAINIEEICPTCGGALAPGRVIDPDLGEIEVVFCVDCDWHRPVGEVDEA